jgi:translation initiation factor eIF-2B subunit delta
MDARAFDKAVEGLREDRRSGAGALAGRCLAILAESASAGPADDAVSLEALLRSRAEALAAVRPSMAAVLCLIGRWRSATSEIPPAARDRLPEFREALADAARRVLAESEAATERVAGLTADYLHRRLAGISKPRVLTLSWSSVIAHALAELSAPGVEVWVAESRPLNEGAALAEFLAGKGVNVTLITDAQVFQAARECALGLCGADALFADGTVVNKIGSALMALALNDAGHPMIAACESFKMAPGGSAAGRFEEMAADELGYGAGRPFALRNVYFEAVPPRLIDAWVTENGVAEDARAFARLNPADPAPPE